MAISDEAFAFLLVLGAGLSTCIGGSVVYFPSLFKLASSKALAASLGLSAGVMLYVSFAEIFVKSQDEFVAAGIDEANAYTYATLCFFGGFVVMIILDKFVHMIQPETHNSICICHDQTEMIDDIVVALQKNGKEDFEKVQEEFNNSSSTGPSNESAEVSDVTGTLDIEGGNTNETKDETKEITVKRELNNMGLTTAIAIGLHNFPEGLATFVATLDSPVVGISLAIAIAIHNIPEGLCVAMPIYFATGDNHKAFLWATISGLSEVVAAALAWAVLANIMSEYVYAVLFGLVAGMMVNISIYQLIPTAHKYDKEDKIVSHSTLLGMAIMATSLIAFMY